MNHALNADMAGGLTMRGFQVIGGRSRALRARAHGIGAGRARPALQAAARCPIALASATVATDWFIV
jgi:hypothetical protein